MSRDRSSEYLHLQWIRTKEVQSGKPPEKTTLRHFVLGEKWVCAAPLTIYITLSTSVRKKKKKRPHRGAVCSCGILLVVSSDKREET